MLTSARRVSLLALLVVLGWSVASLANRSGGVTLRGTLVEARKHEPSLEPPARLADAGLYEPGTHRVAPTVIPYTPQYPLWSDGARKRRWVRLPEGTAIDAANPDDFEYPIGTKFFKEFSFGRPVETRMMERTPNGWRYATYLWDETGKAARLAPANGRHAVMKLEGGTSHDVPSLDDCRACHEGKRNPVLGFGALQLSSDRDPLAPHGEPVSTNAVELDALVRRGLIVNLPDALLRAPPRISGTSVRERAVRGYLFANCSSCHNRTGSLAGLGLDFDVSVVRTLDNSLRQSSVGRYSHFQPTPGDEALRVAAGDPTASVLMVRVASRDPVLQMPPIGTHVPDDAAIALIRAFISEDL